MPLNTTFSSSDISMSDYGANGMPKVAVLGGNDHTVYFNRNDTYITFSGVESAINDALSVPLDLQENFNNSNILAYPNPVNNVLTVSCDLELTDILNIKIVNILGKVVLDIDKNKFISKGHNKINVSDLDPGTYFLTISSSENFESLSFVVQN